MVHLTDLWVGDQVILVNSGRKGRYEGRDKNGRIRVNIGGKVILTTIKNLQIAPEEKPPLFDFDEEDIDTPKLKPNIGQYKKSIDLHIETLAPERKNDLPGQILEFQLQECQRFIRHAINKKFPHVTIIHGKGEGVLKSEVDMLLHEFKEFNLKYTVNNGGATEVYFSYDRIIL